jgi:hypothetical protein
MSKFGFIGPSYTARSNAVADEECINFFAETIETPGAQTQRSYFGTPGLKTFSTFGYEPPRVDNANGAAYFGTPRPLGHWFNGVLWNDFTVNGALPDDAVIQGIYPVIIGSGTVDWAESYWQYGVSLSLSDTGGNAFLQPFNPHTLTFTSTEFWDASIGTSLSALTNQTIKMLLNSSIFRNNTHDSAFCTGCGFAIYYTSATPTTDTQMPAPFAVPAGQGLAWALPLAVSYTDKPGSSDFVAITQSQITSNVVTFTVDPSQGYVPVVGDLLRGVVGTTIDGGALNDGNFVTVTAATANTFSYPWTAADQGPVAETGWAFRIWNTGGGTGSGFGTPATPIPEVPAQSPTRGECWTGKRKFMAVGDSLFEVFEDGTNIKRMNSVLDVFGGPVSIAASTIELLIVAGGRAYCYNLAANTYNDVTASLLASPIKVKYADGYFIVCFGASNKFQISAILDGNTWPGIQVNEVSVFAEDVISIEVSHRELWVMGSQHIQPYQDTGTDEVYDAIPGTLIETGCAATFGVTLLDNTIFWISEDTRGGRQAWRGNGYTPLRISTHAVEASLSSYTESQIASTVSYAYQDGGHLFWVLYIPGTDCSWTYDVAEGMWHKRAEWHAEFGTYGPHRSWNHSYSWGKHLVGDWETGILFEMSLNYLDEDGALIRRLRRSPTLVNEMAWVYHAELTVDFAVGLGPQPPLLDGEGNPRQPQAMLRWSNDRGSTWSNQHIANCGFAGEYSTRVIWRRLGRSRYRVYELSVSDPIPWTIVDAYLRAS